MAEPVHDSRKTGARKLLAWWPQAALAVILAYGAWLRSAWPPVPVSDPDTWGYLHLALSKLLGLGFSHTYGRNFLYPGWVYLCLRVGGSFSAIWWAQHALGLATGAVLWGTWNRWRAWFSHPRLPGWLLDAIGLSMVAFYVSSTTAILFEQEIRPESIFPFFALLAVFLNLEFLRAWFVRREMASAALLAGAVVFDAILAYQLKPSFGLAFGVALSPLLAAIAQPRSTWRWRLSLAGGAALGLLLAGLLVLWPEHEMAKDDESSTLFLPETLLTVHADVIRDQMALDLAAGNPTPYTDSWLTTLHANLSYELTLASQPEQRPYESLGFNPDYLLYRDSFCRFLHDKMSSPRLARLCFYYFERCWLHQPVAMARNVGRQLGIFYGAECPAFWLGRAIDISRDYRKTISAFEPPAYQKQMLAYPPAAAYLAESQRLTGVPDVYRQTAAFTIANTLAAEGHLPLLLAAIAGLAFVLAVPSPATRRELGPAGWLVLLFFAYTFGNCLTVAIVHSLDVDRYSSNLVVFALLGEVTALTWCVEALLCARFRLNPELYPPDPAAAAQSPVNTDATPSR